jgi:hypothetical protein
MAGVWRFEGEEIWLTSRVVCLADVVTAHYEQGEQNAAVQVAAAIAYPAEPCLERQTDSTSRERVDGPLPRGRTCDVKAGRSVLGTESAGCVRPGSDHALYGDSRTPGCDDVQQHIELQPLIRSPLLIAWTQSLAACACTSSGCASSSALAGPICSQSNPDC